MRVLRLDNLSKSSSFSLAWNGTPLLADQNVGLFIRTWTFSDDDIFFKDADGATDLVFGKNGLSNLASTNSTLFLDRAIVRDVQKGKSEGGLVRGKYRAENISAQITD
ncbi:MAG: hypothetical protein HKO66_12190 [Saprospiraceae bacterium]|nr:hypothetical protein [Bacteroidia bacterium]NNL92989.1 hypothetical protein [Saprospiraceae bacterium]